MADVGSAKAPVLSTGRLMGLRITPLVENAILHVLSPRYILCFVQMRKYQFYVDNLSMAGENQVPNKDLSRICYFSIGLFITLSCSGKYNKKQLRN